jgi:hypothetical protein
MEKRKASWLWLIISVLALGVSVVVGAAEEPTTAPTYAVIHYFRLDGDYGDHTTGAYNDFWGLHLWGEGIDPSEATGWTDPKSFLGEDEYGRFAWVKLASEATEVNFIVHRGDQRDPDNSPDRTFDSSVTPEIWLKQDDANQYASQAEAQGSVTVHYHRPGGDYGDPTSPDFHDFWGLHLWGDGIHPAEVTSWHEPKRPDGFDDYGPFFTIQLQDPCWSVNFIVHRGDQRDPDNSPDRSFNPLEAPTIWLQSGDVTVYFQRGAAEGFALLHYRRDAGDYGNYSSPDYNDFWGLHVWGDAPGPGWTTPLKPAAQDIFGVVFRVDLFDGAAQIGYILHRGDEKDPGPDQFLDFSTYGYEVWQLQGADPENPYILPLLAGPGTDCDNDGDGVPDDEDNCPDYPNPDQSDTDGNGVGDRCDLDWLNAGLQTCEEELDQCCPHLIPGECGDGRIQWKAGETCDPPGSSCGNGWVCDDFCKCVPLPPVCGDGKIQWRAGEQCEPVPGLDRCGPGRVCDPSQCVCVPQGS